MEDAPTPIAELEQGPSKFEEFLENNQKKLIILAILIFLGVIAFVFFKGYKDKVTKDAGVAIMKAEDESAYNKVISSYSSSAAAGTAAMAIANLRTSDDDKIAALNHFINTYPDHPGVPTKLLELALIQTNSKKIQDAESNLNKLIANDKASHLIPRAKIALADIAAAKNEIPIAEEIYNEIKDANDNHFSHIAASRLLYLKAKPPVVVNPEPTKTDPAQNGINPLKPIQPATPSLNLSTPPATTTPPANPLNPITPTTPSAPEIPAVPTTPTTPDIPAVPTPPVTPTVPTVPATSTPSPAGPAE